MGFPTKRRGVKAMFSKVVTTSVVAFFVAAAPAAFADHKGAYWQDDGGRMGPSYDYAKVISVDPIVRQVRIETPRRECWTDTTYDDHASVYNSHQGAAGNMILGGLIGAAIGNQFGRGDGRRAATVAGALIGTAIGHDAASRRDYQYGSRVYEPRQVERCNVRYESRYEERIEGYNVVYVYGGQQHTTRLAYDPGERIKVRVDVAPAEG
jgi:uncharacterized protein YcfJ